MKEIGRSTFNGCKALNTIILPIGVNKIGKGAFYECSALSTIYVPAGKSDYYKKRLPEELHNKIIELKAEKKIKAKK